MTSNQLNIVLGVIIMILLGLIVFLTFRNTNNNKTLYDDKTINLLSFTPQDTSKATQWIQGQSYEIRWTGGDKITLAFVNQVLMDTSIDKSPTIWSKEIPNTGSYTFTVPQDFPIDKGPYVFYLKDNLGNIATSRYFSITSQVSQPHEESINWKEIAYDQFKGLTDWKVEEKTNWRLVSLSQDQLTKYGKGKILTLTKGFNDNGEANFPGQEMLEGAVKQSLKANGWILTAEPTEGGFYNDYLYTNNGHPLVLQLGTRDAVKGGIYVMIQFQY